MKCGHCSTSCKASKLVKIVVARVRCDQLGEDEYTVDAGQLLNNMLPDSEFDQDEVISGILSMESDKVKVNIILKTLSEMPPVTSRQAIDVPHHLQHSHQYYHCSNQWQTFTCLSKQLTHHL